MSQTLVQESFEAAPAAVPADAAGQTAGARPSLDESRRSSVFGSLLELSKFRLSSLVLVTTLIGYVLAARSTPPASDRSAPDSAWYAIWPASLDFVALLLTMLGTALAAFGANALNQFIEVERDMRMLRTRRRPLPSGRLSRPQAFAFAATASLAGPLILTLGVNVIAGALAALTLLIYVAIYTPLKVVSPLNTLVGAICGALPPMLGWAAASGRLDWGAWILGAILFLWQIPHFLALAWLYRDDYERGGFRMLPVVDRDGRFTGYVSVTYSLALVPVSIWLTLAGVCGWQYSAVALLLGAGLAIMAVRLRLRPGNTEARQLFLASVIYLPLLLLAMLLK